MSNDTEQTYYRPEWTCGRYDEKHKAAIFYNLIEGMSYFFNGTSALVVGCILRNKRNVSFYLKDISSEADIKEEILLPFMEQLVGLGLLTHELYNDVQTSEYRTASKKQRAEYLEQYSMQFQEETVISNSGAESDYANAVGCYTSVMFELTYRCSECCIHCYNAGAVRNFGEKSLRGNRKELDLDEYKSLIDQLNDQGLVKVCLSGGDPFSKSIVWDIIDYLYEKEIAFDVFTNGISVVGDVARLANRYPRLVGVSLYSDDADVHDSITRVKGSHDKTIEFIRLCSEFAIPLNIKCCIMKPNAGTYQTVKDIARKYVALPQFDINITDSVDGDKCASLNLRLSEEAMRIVLRDKDLPYYIGKGETATEKPISPSGYICSAGIQSLCITPEGNIQPCCSFPMKIGNVRNGQLSNILKVSDTLNWWKSVRVKDLTECNTHEYCKFCQMCAGNNYVSNGTPLKPSENNCSIAKIRYDLSLDMAKENDPLKGRSLAECLANIDTSIPVLKRVESVNYRDKETVKWDDR